MIFKYQLRSGSKKEFCPNCNKKTFVPFIETETGNELPAHGRCDREIECAFFLQPETNEPTFAPKFESIEKETDYISNEEMEKFYLGKNNNSFIRFLRTKFTQDKVFEAEQNYFLSDHAHGVIFWQIDQIERIRSGKIMEYNPTTGKRLKDADGKSKIDWVHKKPFNLKQCLFGLHLMKENPNKPIGIVESEKTAVIMSLKENRLIWMACGSLNGFKMEYLAPLRLRKIVAFPDKGCFEIWQEVADSLNNTGFNITVNDVLENNPSVKKGDDIADLI